MPTSTPRHRRVLPAAAALGLILAGCGGPGFDPAEATPCEFFTEADLDESGLESGELDELAVVSPDLAAVDAAGCSFTKKPGWSDSIPHIVVGYLDQTPAEAASVLDLTATADYGDLVEYRNMADLERSGTSTCRLLGASGDDRAVLYQFRVDTSRVNFFQEPPDHPCDYVISTSEVIAGRLGADR